MRRRLYELFVCVAIVAVLATVIFSVLGSGDGQSPCLRNLRNAWSALSVYASEHDGRLPEADRWMDMLGKGLEPPFRCEGVAQGNGYAFNAALSGGVMEEDRILVFDSYKLGRNESDFGTSFPTPGRHSDGKGNYAIYGSGSLLFVPAATLQPSHQRRLRSTNN